MLDVGADRRRRARRATRSAWTKCQAPRSPWRTIGRAWRHAARVRLRTITLSTSSTAAPIGNAASARLKIGHVCAWTCQRTKSVTEPSWTRSTEVAERAAGDQRQRDALPALLRVGCAIATNPDRDERGTAAINASASCAAVSPANDENAAPRLFGELPVPVAVDDRLRHAGAVLRGRDSARNMQSAGEPAALAPTPCCPDRARAATTPRSRRTSTARRRDHSRNPSRTRGPIFVPRARGPTPPLLRSPPSPPSPPPPPPPPPPGL